MAVHHDSACCQACKVLFEADPLLQAEILHVVAVEGMAAGRRLLNERLEEQHAGHELDHDDLGHLL